MVVVTIPSSVTQETAAVTLVRWRAPLWFSWGSRHLLSFRPSIPVLHLSVGGNLSIGDTCSWIGGKWGIGVVYC